VTSGGDETRVLARFRSRRILVVGDAMLDRTVRGRVRRVSPEAPVPVVEDARTVDSPGGAANAAVNVMRLGGDPVLVGVVGDDLEAELLRRELERAGIAGNGLLVDPSRPTTTKMRIAAQSQQIVRVDHECCAPLAAPLRARLLAAVAAAGDVDAVIVSDYAKGVVDDVLVPALAARRAGRAPLVVDPKGHDPDRYTGADYLTPNVHEALVLTGERDPDPRAPLAVLERAAVTLRSRLGCRAVLVTRGPDGMLLATEGGAMRAFPARVAEVFDATGAGDASIAAFTMALASHASAEAAAAIANRAAGLAVRERGAAGMVLADLAAELGGAPVSASDRRDPVRS
jgi:rfaE bifunctional protein kinase chain/domain